MKRWLFREPPAGSPPRGLARELSISPLLLDILWRRGLDSPEELDAYLSARLPDLVPPSRWPQFPQAAEVISKALLDGKKLAVWGDYDVDGITSSTLVLDVLEAHGLETLWHVPDRRSEGYGLNVPAIEALAAQGCGILLTVDCGISDVAAVARARELGMTVVVSDHHLPPPELPPADAICNPRLGPEDDMPCPHLAGVGVAFFLMAAVNAALAPHTGRRFKMDRVLDLVALGTLADVMRLGGQNRILVRGGLDKLAEAARPGIAALKTVSGSDAPASTPDRWSSVWRRASMPPDAWARPIPPSGCCAARIMWRPSAWPGIWMPSTPSAARRRNASGPPPASRPAASWSSASARPWCSTAGTGTPASWASWPRASWKNSTGPPSSSATTTI